MSILHVDSVLKSFGNHNVLTDVFISCNKGEIIGLLGRNGSGKSTLLKIIFGAITANQKFVKVNNQIVNRLWHNKHLIKYLPQNHFLPSHLSVSMAIDLFCDKRKRKQVKNNKLIVPLIYKKCKHLSGGEKRLLEVLMVIYSNSEYVLIDEPFNGIAPVHKTAIKEIILNESSEKGFIITDHDYNSIIEIASRLIIMHDGKTREIKSKKELVAFGYLPEKG